MSLIGSPVPRVDGALKVTGAATYAAEFAPDGLLYASVVPSTIARGRITAMDVSAALAVPGVVHVLSHLNQPALPWHEQRTLVDPDTGERLRPLANDFVVHQGQFVAAVVAETREAARYAASLVRVAYAPEPAVTAIGTAIDHARVLQGKDQQNSAPGRSVRGAPEAAYLAASVKIDQTYIQPRHNHNAMELHTCTAAWNGDVLTLWDKTQWVQNCAEAVATAFGMEPAQVHVIAPFVGGAFGSSLRVWPHTYIAAMAARAAGRPVKLELSRRECYTGTGYRPYTVQTVKLAADHDGKLAAMIFDCAGETSDYEDYTEATQRPQRMLYACANLATEYRMAKRAVNTSTPMRAPGECTGLYAMECAMDELAYALDIDPVELRLRNIPDRDQAMDLPFSSSALAECLRTGAERFGWSRRERAPRSMRDGRLLIGMGMASAAYPTNILPAMARARLLPDGSAEVETAASDMGPGTWTSLTQVAAETLGLPVERVRLKIGDSKLPKAPVHGGSLTMASVGHAVRAACLNVLQAAAERAGSNAPVEAEGQHDPGDLAKRFSTWAFGAVFTEVAVDPDTAEIRVRRVSGAYGNGRIINPRLARSQSIGGIIQGVGAALMEATEVDDRTGRVVNANLAEYLVPVLADTPEIDIHFVHEDDPHLGPLGAKGIGEIALCGITPAIVNAVFHATGHRVRQTPVTPDRLLDGAIGFRG